VDDNDRVSRAMLRGIRNLWAGDLHRFAPSSGARCTASHHAGPWLPGPTKNSC
jgi:hypothetical protein